LTTSSPSPYSFAYNTADVAGTQLVRQEAGDANGAVRGRYGYRDADGLYRTVEYIADSNGFRAAIRSNEPGLGNSADNAASVYLQTEATPSRVASKVASASSLARQRAQNTLSTTAPALPRLPSTTRGFTTTSTTAQPRILASLTPLAGGVKGGVESRVESAVKAGPESRADSGVKGGRTSPLRVSDTRVGSPVAAARANSLRKPTTLRLISSKVVSLPRLAPTTSTTTTTTTTTTTEAPAIASQQFLSAQANDQQIQSDSLSSGQQLEATQQKISSPSDDQQEQVKSEQPDRQLATLPESQPVVQSESLGAQSETQPEDQSEDQPEDQPEVRQEVQPEIRQEVQPEIRQEVQPVARLENVQQKQNVQPDQTIITNPIQPEVTFNGNDNQDESLSAAPVQPQVAQPHLQTHIAHQQRQQPHIETVHGENPLLVRFLDEDLTYDSLEFPHAQHHQPRTIAIHSDDHPLSRLYRIVPIPHHESIRLHQAGANMMYLRNAQLDY